MDDDEAYDVSHFALDWEREVATCPQGKRSRYWKPTKRVKDRGTIPMVQVHFHKDDCAACAARPLCTRKRAGPRELTLHVREHHEAMVAARERQETGAFWERYSARAGVEGAVSQGVRTSGMRRSRYRGLAKTHLQHVATAAAMNPAAAGGRETSRRLAGRRPALGVVPVAVLSADGGMREFANNIQNRVVIYGRRSESRSEHHMGRFLDAPLPSG